ncbi:unnamed protein product [Caenorhabditis angaria]|uniref:ATP synthase mitochondrial F1 complex assembly factor 2 n=1 Tax=Caenorhabditis angaria TaxID=860376 RepID=A0A9P1IQB6_9PELO|nr:unnamed protein product [Caenorhabditis angaria]
MNLGITIRRFVASNASALSKPKRFYKEVSIVNESDEKGNQIHKILLDHRTLKTQGGKILKLDSYPLALAIAEEWASQNEFLRLGQMRLTGLAFTAQDNPLEQTTESITQKVLDYVDGDTVLFFNNESEKLERYQEENWRPLINNLNNDLNIQVRPSQNILDCDVASEQDKEKIERWIKSHNFPALIGLQYATESIKSFVVAYNAIRHHIDAEQAVDATTLEQRTQAETWGTVEWSHGLEREELISRLSAACLFVYFNSNNLTSKVIENSARA